MGLADYRRQTDVDSDTNPIAAYVRSFAGDLIYLPFRSTADEFAKAWERVASRPAASEAAYQASQVKYEKLQSDVPTDGLWLTRDEQTLRPREDQPSVELSHGHLIRQLLAYLPRSVNSLLRKSAQLGINNRVISGNPDDHDRWNHSLGAVTVGLIWYRSLATQSPDELRERDEALLSAALILHDYGHLPFSHLTEQLLEEINWRSAVHLQFGSELSVLSRRLADPASDMSAFLAEMESRAGLPVGSGASAILRLVAGCYGRPWLSAIVNSAIDADKIDYLARDVFELSKTGQLGFQSRLPHSRPKTWLAEFLADQAITAAGLLAFHGRSAMALRDLIEERQFLYRALYRSPELRGAERIAIEFVRQYLITAVWRHLGERPASLVQEFCPDMRELKNEICQEVLIPHEHYDPSKEWTLLEDIEENLRAAPFEPKYRELLVRCWDLLGQMTAQRGLGSLRERLGKGFLVERPFYFLRRDFEALRAIIRPLQLQYCCDVLFDLVSVPGALSNPAALSLRLWTTRPPVQSVNVLVPAGHSGTWSFGSRASVALSEEAFTAEPFNRCMVYIFDPFMGERPEAYYAFDKFWAACRREGLTPLPA